MGRNGESSLSLMGPRWRVNLLKRAGKRVDET
jgi:hypothetical protein